MSLNAAELEAVARELAPLAGARVGAAWVSAERALTVELAGRGEPALLFVSAEADLTRAHAATRRPPQPEHPYAFQHLLRAEIEGARVASISALGGDRVLRVELETKAGRRTLVAELTGRHGNVFLLDGDGVILASAGRNLSQRRKLVKGERYEPPAPRPAPGETLRFEPVAGARFPLSAAIERAYAAREEEQRAGEARRRLREPIRAAAARSRRALDKIAEDAARVPKAEEDRRKGDLLKQSLHLVKRGQKSVLLTEYTAQGPRAVEVPLDPALSPRENMEKYYRHYKRIVESAQRVAAREREVRARLDALVLLAAEVEEAQLEALPRLEREARRLGAAPRPPQKQGKRRKDEALPPYRLFRSASGAAILVGRGAAANDELTVRVAKGNDLWLHARGQAGAHVVVRAEPRKGEAGYDEETLLDAAHLAAWFSDARGGPACDVAFTRAKYVKKKKGSPPGAVTYSQDKTLALRVEPGRTERLLASEEEP